MLSVSDNRQPRRSKFNSVNVQEVHSNVEQEVIEITTDKLKIILIEHLDSLLKGSSWQTPLSILITVLIVFCTANFQPFLTLSADSWKAIFVLLGIGSAIWLLYALSQMKKKQSVDDFLDRVKNKT
ncbi:hypothetical protein ATN50_01140 [Vibrio parahaemolyticus]|nr:hypothetical protein [Vibrio parahaemolyticus]RFD50937.1 hypothetical protein H332_020485 [Vibrio parahaemolyticus 3646]RFD60520.1 hypothetical protein H330_017665 [Vibrio parahaemolyticus 3631]EGR1304348.1 hypothetical protein [Vibrio parahaemolyticus]EGR1335619.1 hypothetical protein [Vibrio parahaemolyticus]